MIRKLNRYEALLFVLGVLASAYVVAFVSLYDLRGDLAFLPAALLVAGVGWLWGLWAGLLAGALTFPLLLVLLGLAGGQAVGNGLIESGLLVGTPVMAAIGGGGGRLREQHERGQRPAGEGAPQASTD